MSSAFFILGDGASGARMGDHAVIEIECTEKPFDLTIKGPYNRLNLSTRTLNRLELAPARSTARSLDVSRRFYRF